MKQDHFQIVSNGVQDGRDEEAVLRALVKRLQAPPETLRKFLSSTPQRIEIVDNESTAEQLCRELRDIGLHCEIHAGDLAVTAPAESPPTPQTPAPDSRTDRTKGVYEMLWDCEYCGTKKLLGLTHRFCPTCASPQNAAKRYFPSDTERVAVEDHDYYGVDRVCAACSTPSSAKAEFCTQCGHPLTDAAKAKLHSMQADGAAPGDAPYRHTVSTTGKKKLKKTLIGGIEDFRPRAQSQWCSQLPGDAYSVSRRQEVRSYNQVPDGEECAAENVDQGDGTYRVVERCRPKYRRVPVYDDKCDYTVDRWEYKRSITAEGSDKSPFWPEVKLTQSGDCIGCERESARDQRYLVLLQGPEDRYSCQLDQSRWQETAVNSQWQLDVGAVAGDARCDSLQMIE